MGKFHKTHKVHKVLYPISSFVFVVSIRTRPDSSYGFVYFLTAAQKERFSKVEKVNHGHALRFCFFSTFSSLGIISNTVFIALLFRNILAIFKQYFSHSSKVRMIIDQLNVGRWAMKKLQVKLNFK